MLSKDGIVIASDGQSTERKGDQWIRTSFEKIHPLGKEALWGASGDGGAIQEVRKQLNALDPTELEKHEVARSSFTNIIFQVNKPRFDRFKAIPREGGPPILDEALMIQYDGEHPRIVEFVVDGSSTNYEALGYQAIGSGGIFARASLHGYRTHDLSLDQAKVLAYMTVMKAIDIAAFGLGNPIDVWTLSRKENATLAERINDQDKNALGDTALSICKFQIEVFTAQAQCGPERHQ